MGQQYNEQLMALQMQAGTQRAALEQQAMQISMEYEQRKAEEHMYRQQYEIQQAQADMQTKIAQDYAKTGAMTPQGALTPQPPPPYVAQMPVVGYGGGYPTNSYAAPGVPTYATAVQPVYTSPQYVDQRRAPDPGAIYMMR